MRIALGMSGGVDSTVAACLLRAQGHTVIGVTMQIWDGRFQAQPGSPSGTTAGIRAPWRWIHKAGKNASFDGFRS